KPGSRRSTCPVRPEETRSGPMILSLRPVLRHHQHIRKSQVGRPYADGADPFGGKLSAALRKIQPAMICKKTMAHQISSTSIVPQFKEGERSRDFHCLTWRHRYRSRLVHDLLAARPPLARYSCKGVRLARAGRAGVDSQRCCFHSLTWAAR